MTSTKVRPTTQAEVERLLPRILARTVPMPDGCRLWTRGQNGLGYGRIWLRVDGEDRGYYPHRIVLLVP